MNDESHIYVNDRLEVTNLINNSAGNLWIQDIDPNTFSYVNYGYSKRERGYLNSRHLPMTNITMCNENLSPLL